MWVIKEGTQSFLPDRTTGEDSYEHRCSRIDHNDNPDSP